MSADTTLLPVGPSCELGPLCARLRDVNAKRTKKKDTIFTQLLLYRFNFLFINKLFILINKNNLFLNMLLISN